MSAAVADNVTLKAPFPAFGGKSVVADLVWARLGDVRNYVEPFCFSAAMLLSRPGGAGSIETVNDSNCFVANFWRAVQKDPDAVAAHADWPVNEADLHARHRWLVHSDLATAQLRKVREDPEWCDARIAGWWCWGACMWIGSGWCDESHRNSGSETKPDTGDARGVHGKVPMLSSAGCGVTPGPGDGIWDGRGTALQSPRHINNPPGENALGGGKRPRAHSGPSPYMPGVLNGTKAAVGGVDGGGGRPQLADAYSRGRGVHGRDEFGTCAQRRAWLTGWMRGLCDRLRSVRVCCGDWQRVCNSESTLTRLGLTGVFLDPPYRQRLADGTENRAAHIYANDRTQDVSQLCDQVEAWCLKWGSHPQIRIALCGLEGEYPGIDALVGVGPAKGWDRVAWKSRGGYGNRTERGKENAGRERVWFSPECAGAKNLWDPTP